MRTAIVSAARNPRNVSFGSKADTGPIAAGMGGLLTFADDPQDGGSTMRAVIASDPGDGVVPIASSLKFAACPLATESVRE